MKIDEKKTEVITIRTTTNTKQILEEEANKREWTISKLAEKILSTWAENSKEKSQIINFNGNTITNIEIK